MSRIRSTFPSKPTAEPAAGEPELSPDVVARFLTQGGAVVELHSTRFTTRWRGGPPFAANKPYPVDGFNWRCLGCAALGREGETYDDPAFRKQSEARGDANTHAEKCRAMPRPEGGGR